MNSYKDKNGIWLLPDLVELDLEGAFGEKRLNTPLFDVEVDLASVLEEADKELVRIVSS